MITISEKKITCCLEINERFITFTDNVFKPHFVKFKFEFEFDENLTDITIGGLSFDVWLSSLLGDKVVLSAVDDLPSGVSNETLVVSNVDVHYISDTIFKITNKLLPIDIKLTNISYEEII